MALKVLILGSFRYFNVLRTDFNGVVVRSNGYKTLSSNNGYFFCVLLVSKELILISLRYF